MGPSGSHCLCSLLLCVFSCFQDDRCKTPLSVLASLMPASAVPTFRCPPSPCTPGLTWRRLRDLQAPSAVLPAPGLLPCGRESRGCGFQGSGTAEGHRKPPRGTESLALFKCQMVRREPSRRPPRSLGHT